MRAMLFALAMMAASPAWSGTLLVLESDGVPAVTAGQIIDGQKEIAVPAGARLVLMDERGMAATVKGPYTGVPGGGERAAGPSFLERLAAVLTAPPTTPADTVLGATRAVGQGPKAPSVWAIDAAASGEVCVRTSADVVLWRPAPRPMRIVNMSSEGKTISFTWPANEATVAWPAGLEIADGASYQLSLGSSEKLQSFKINTAKLLLENDTVTLRWLSETNCAAQARVLLAQVGARRVVEGPAVAGPLFE